MKLSCLAYYSSIVSGVNKEGKSYYLAYFVPDDNRPVSFRCDGELADKLLKVHMGSLCNVTLQYFEYQNSHGFKLVDFEVLEK